MGNKAPRRRPGRLITTEPEGIIAVADDEPEPETGPLRRCIVTRQVLPKEQMIRFVIGPDRQVVPDLAAKLPGRGMWLSASWDVLLSATASQTRRGNGADGHVRHVGLQLGGAPETSGSDGPAAGQGIERPAIGRGRDAPDKALVRAFSRAARGAVVLPPDLPGILRTGLVQRITASLGLARRAGQAVAGFEKARELVKAGRAGLLVQAEDGSAAERARFLSTVGSGPASRLTVIAPVSGADLGRVFGRDYVVHIAIAPGKLADSLLIDASRLSGLTKRSNGTTERTNAPLNEVAGTDEQI